MVFDKIVEIIVENLDVDASVLTLESNLADDLDADSLDLFQMISEIEEEFDVKFDNIEEIKTIGDVVAVIEAK